MAQEPASCETFATNDTDVTTVDTEEVISPENTKRLSKKCRRKSMKNMNLKPDKRNDCIRVGANNNNDTNHETSPDERMTNENVGISTEVIDIEKEFVRAKLLNGERHGTKRKKAKIDQLLSRVEAKHGKLKNTDCSTPNITLTTEDSTSIFSRMRTSDTETSPSISTEHFSSTLSSSEDTNNLVSSRSSFRRNHNHAESQITSSVLRKCCEKEQIKLNKRTLSTNERYSKLTSTQLQRRLVANARERSRVHALSNAFDALRCTIPSYSTEQKLSKLTILRVAINYINALEKVLNPVPSIEDQSDFKRYVDECTDVLQTEYGRSKNK